MRDQERLVLKLVAGLLDYPGHPAFWMRLREHASLAEEADARLGAVSKALQRVVPIELEKLYVAAFDFDPKGSLYVTAHELGDSRDRGQALIELTELCQKAGYDVPDDQLADYLPLLLKLHVGDCRGHAARLLPIHPTARPPALHRAEAAVPRAGVPQNHEGGCFFLFPTLEYVGTPGFLANRVKRVSAHDALQPVVVRSRYGLNG